MQKKSASGPDNTAYLFTRYGRVGDNGVKTIDTMAFPAAIKKYHKSSKAKQRKGYTEIKLAGTTGETDAAAGGGKASTKAMVSIVQTVAPSRHSRAVQNLMKFFFDKEMIESSVISVKVDVQKMPLGKLSKETVLKGYAILSNIEKELNGKSNAQVLANLSGDFYTNIPHNFGRMNMARFVIDSMK